MPEMSRTQLYAAIRRDLRAGLSKNAIQRKYRVGHDTISKAAESSWPDPRKEYPDRGSKLDVFKPLIDDILRADLYAPRKQRHTATRIYHRLLDEHEMADVSYWLVRRYVADRKPQIRIEEGREPADQVFVPQSHQPGAEAEVDFGDITINCRGEDVVWSLFSMRMSFSGKAIHHATTSAGQEAFLEGHVHAFAGFGGVPHRIRYDNLTAAVSKVLGLGRQRVETERWTAFRSCFQLTELRHAFFQFSGHGVISA